MSVEAVFLPMVLCPMSVSLLRYLLVGECFYDWGPAGFGINRFLYSLIGFCEYQVSDHGKTRNAYVLKPDVEKESRVGPIYL